MSGHTPGEWLYQEESDAYTHIVRDSDGKFIAQLPQDTSGVAEANARLIAAAPDLLAIAERIRDDDSWRTKDNTIWPTLIAAIAKATGESA